jgi:hypothetical protein
MGDVHVHGGMANTIEVQGDCHLTGGFIDRCYLQTGAQTTSQQPEPRVVYRDRVVYKDRVVYRDNPGQATEIINISRENEKLRQALKERDEKQPSDDILISKIRRLKDQLDKEREAHQNEIEELEWRLKAVTDIANERNERIYEDETQRPQIAVTDDSLDVLFTLINEYPIASDRDMTEEMGISITTLRYIAKILRLVKSPEARREAKERLKRHGIQMIERRGGDQTKDKREKLSKTTIKQK